VGSHGASAKVKSRRFDTEAVLKKILNHDKEGFASFYERYRGRVYRFIVRQYGTSEYGKAAYYSTWRHLVVAGINSSTPKELKISFFQYLGTSAGTLMSAQRAPESTNYLPKDIEQDENWSLALIEYLKKLGDDQKRYFLFKHEIGISEAAIARTFSVKRKSVESCIRAAEEDLKNSLHEAGMPESISMEKVYRESRVVKPPHSWDQEILESFDIWVKQADDPATILDKTKGQQSSGGIAGKWHQLRDQIKNKFTSVSKKSSTKNNRDRKFSSSHN
jgi:DNA-directed RNA polymerase specialized sigma24 family protein